MASASESGDLTVLSWNINGLKDKFKKKERKTALLEIFDRYDVVLLHERHIGEMKDDKDYNKNWKIITEALSKKYARVKLEDQTCRETADTQEEEEEEEEEDDEEEEEEEKKKTMYMTNFSSHIEGVAILVNKPHTLLKAFYEGGDYAWVHVEIDQQKYTFVSVYDHDNYNQILSDIMMEILTEGSDKYAFKCRLVIGGDFNTTLDPELDATTDNPDHAERRKTLKELLSIVNMSDVWREKHPGERRYTHKSMSRSDYVFMLEDDVKYVTSCEILDDIDLSDHSPVSLTLNYTDSPQPTEE
ncbi:hypothetical protein R3I93_004723 [Phoxinus phoxinus]|uniref:Endonuclease/exonuclease/phosphatase domain-containing protein n=1 Tax=Phoxinus phoxinus TaxID=58324 RepID=A0AAN9DAX9_9TELE